MTDPNELADKIEALDGPSREVDAEIYAMLNPHMKQITPKKKYMGRFFDPKKVSNRTAMDYHVSGGATAVSPRVTASLDAAMTLVPDDWPRMVSDQRGLLGMRASAEILCNPAGKIQKITANADTPALALCAAALRARGGNR